LRGSVNLISNNNIAVSIKRGFTLHTVASSSGSTHTVTQSVNHSAHTLGSFTVVGGESGNIYAELRGIGNGESSRSRGAQAFCGYATTVQASTTGQVALNEHHIFALVCLLGGKFIAAGTGTNDYKVSTNHH
jgi:hypothetical protein